MTRDDKINLAILAAALLFAAIFFPLRLREHVDALFSADVTKPFLDHGVELP